MASEITVKINQLFTDVASNLSKIGDEPFKQKVLKTLLAGTPHKDLISLHQDMGIDIVKKSMRYGMALGIINEWKSKLSEFAGLGDDFPVTNEGIFNNTVFSVVKLDNNQKKEFEQIIETQAKKVTEYDKALKDLSIKINKVTNINSKLREQIDLEEKTKTKIVNILLGDTVIFSIDSSKEKHHKQLLQIFEYLKARNHEGFTEFLWIDGAPGSGKTRMGRTLAKMLNVSFYPRPADPTVTSNKLTGFNNLLNGTFVEGWFYRPYKDGGLLALDEGDLMDASCFAGCNSIENSEYTFGNGELINRHKDFYLVVFANTRGQGATRGFQRNKLDAATLDRFTMVKLEYDDEMEQEVYGNKQWAEYVQKVRAYVARACPESLYITPRATRKGAAYLAAGMKSEEVARNTIFKLCTVDTYKAIIANCGQFVQTDGSVLLPSESQKDLIKKPLLESIEDVLSDGNQSWTFKK